MSTETPDVLRWLEALANQYENAARSIRQTVVMIQQTELVDRVEHPVHRRSHHNGDDGGDTSVQIGEAVRRVLGGSLVPLKASEIWQAIKTTKIALRTRSSDPRNLLDVTLAGMERSGQIHRTTARGRAGKRGETAKWQLVT